MTWYQIFYDICNNLKTRNKDKTEETMKDKNKFGQREFNSSYQRTYDPFKVTMDDVRQVNNEMIKGLGIPEDKMMFRIHLTGKEINSIYREVIQEIQKY